jgi:hypothetical protein
LFKPLFSDFTPISKCTAKIKISEYNQGHISIVSRETIGLRRGIDGIIMG